MPDPRPAPPAFPCAAAPTGREARLLGLYDQRQEGFLMQRVRVPGGRLSSAQARGLAALAAAFTPGRELHLTTRQDVEFHWVEPGRVPELQRGIAALGLDTSGACGDTFRNLTLCPGCDLACGRGDLAALAAAIHEALRPLPCLWSLPRKFKISLSACGEACARPWIQDLAFVGRGDGLFDAIGAGSLGPRPATGILLHQALPAGDLPALARAAVLLFDAEGDRANRGRARLRHVRQRLGDEAFRAALDALFAREKTGSPAAVPPRPLPPRPGPIARLRFTGGQLQPSILALAADWAEPRGLVLRVGFEHDLLLHGALASELPLALQAFASGPRIVACPGTRLCQRGLVDAHAAAEALRAALPEDAPLVAISGCPNQCTHAAAAEIGLVGRLRTGADGKPEQRFQLLLGGENGKGPRLAAEVHPALAAEDLPAALWGVLARRRERPQGSFADFVAAEGEALRKMAPGT